MIAGSFKLALVTCDALPRLTETERGLIPLLEEQGIEGIPVIWSDEQVVWKNFDGLLIRSIWDYYLHPEAFQHWLEKMEALSIPAWNPIPMIRENSHKFYLKKLSQAGIPIIPSLFVPQGSKVLLKDVFKENNWNEVIIKPAISAGAHQTYFFQAHQLGEGQKTLENLLAEKDLLLQAFAQEVAQMGELSCMFFQGNYSHTVIKKPQAQDFRVQEEYGGSTQIYPASAQIIQQVQQVLDVYTPRPLYARIDGIIRQEVFHLMEMELIEPELFLDHYPPAYELFIKAIVEKFK